jgi:hypothetical protein
LLLLLLLPQLLRSMLLLLLMGKLPWLPLAFQARITIYIGCVV